MPYRLLPNVALADIAFEAKSKTPNGLFESCARALTDVMVDRKGVKPRLKRSVSITSESYDRLLYDFLTELIILKDVDSFLFKEFHVSIDADSFSLEARMLGERIDRARHGLRNDVKAVTMHMFRVERSASGWKAVVVLDI